MSRGGRACTQAMPKRSCFGAQPEAVAIEDPKPFRQKDFCAEASVPGVRPPPTRGQDRDGVAAFAPVALERNAVDAHLVERVPVPAPAAAQVQLERIVVSRPAVEAKTSGQLLVVQRARRAGGRATFDGRLAEGKLG